MPTQEQNRGQSGGLKWEGRIADITTPSSRNRNVILSKDLHGWIKAKRAKPLADITSVILTTPY